MTQTSQAKVFINISRNVLNLGNCLPAGEAGNLDIPPACGQVFEICLPAGEAGCLGIGAL